MEKIKVCDKAIISINGVVVDTIDDLITDDGLAWIAGRLKGTSPVAGWIGVGTGTTAPDATDSALETEVARVALVTSGGVVTNNTISFQGEFTAGVAVGAISEFGLFDAATDGTLILRNVKGPYNTDSTDIFTITITITFSVGA